MIPKSTSGEDSLRALRANQDERRMIIDPILDAILFMDGRGFITDWNPQATELFGRSKSDVVGHSMPEIIVPAPLREEFHQGLHRFGLDGEWAVLNRRVETTALHQDGHEFPVELTIIPLLNEGARSFSVFVRDLSGRKEAEYALQRETSFVELLQRVAIAANEAQSVERALQFTLEQVCR
jgi:phosphoserine phosphatase RsbU/P